MPPNGLANGFGLASTRLAHETGSFTPVSTAQAHGALILGRRAGDTLEIMLEFAFLRGIDNEDGPVTGTSAPTLAFRVCASFGSSRK